MNDISYIMMEYFFLLVINQYKQVGDSTTFPMQCSILKARSHIETQLNSTVELSWVSVSFDM